MPFSKQLKTIALMGALGASFFTTEAKEKNTADNNKAPVRMEQSVKPDWTWGTDTASFREKLAYKSLPAEYKAFANKTFMERFEMREEWEQKDFLKRDRKRTALLKRNPDATFKDFEPKTSAPNLKLADYPVAAGSFINKIIREQADGKLSYFQAKVAWELATLGRPLATIDPNLPYADQLKLCGFDVAADVAKGTSFYSLSAREQSIYVAQDQDAEALNDRNERARIELRARFSKEREEEEKSSLSIIWPFPTKVQLLSEEETKGLFPREVINGKDVGIRQPNEVSYSIHDEVTRKVAAKIEKEEQEAAKRAQDLAKSR